MPTIPTNRELRLAGDYVQHTGCNIFLTGKAGTGKTTFLHNLKKNTAKHMIVTAPTGVAAMNAGGVTLHSFFQLPFGPFMPGSEAYESRRRSLYRFSREKKRIMQNLDLLVIDEISMVRADLLDAVDMVLRRQRRINRPFGGLQLLLIGDLYQLPPVVKQDEWQLLGPHYDSVYFFSSHALAQTEVVTIELKHIYRQSDARFIRLLNRVRENRLGAAAIAELNRRCLPNFTPDDAQGYITLTTHNAQADAINNIRLRALKTREKCFKADISGDFPAHIYPTPAMLRLKIGAQVMFLRNDASPEKRYFNGKIGKIRNISDNAIKVACPDDPEDIEVEPVEWENIKYSMTPENKAIEQEIIGKFKQYPLKLAWAITIHKSQGLTFDKAVINAQAAFAHGQVYVALSRCRTFEGLVLSSPIPAQGVQTDQAVRRFDAIARTSPPSEKRLLSAKAGYQQQLVLDCFDFQRLQNHLNHLDRLTKAHARVIRLMGVADIGQVRRRCAKKILAVGEKFKNQLRAVFEDHTLPETDAYVLERITKASAWFTEQFALIFDGIKQKIGVETDNRELGKQIGNVIFDMQRELAIKLAGIKACENGFSSTRYLRAVSNAGSESGPEKEKKHPVPEYDEADIEHPKLFQSLRDWRARKAKEQKVAHFQILHQRVLIQIVVFLPDNRADLLKIKGVGKQTVAKYGEELVALVSAYRKEHGIIKVVLPALKSASQEDGPLQTETPPSSTQQISFDMFNKGMTIDRIAQERSLVPSTIEGHLCFFVEKGQLDIGKMVAPAKQGVIEKAVAASFAHTLGEIKKDLGDDYSYSDIKLVLAHLKYQAKKMKAEGMG
jgi:DNA-directed RNA polymerase subunit F